MGGASRKESSKPGDLLNEQGNVNGAATSDFGYEEFDGRDGKTCPTCQGTGRISRSQEDELVALIPYNDKRLKPRRTLTYVALAIAVSVLICGLVLFFILPRSIKIAEGGTANYTVTLNKNLSSTIIVVNNQFNITNTNFFRVEVTKIDVEAFFDQVQVGQGHLKPSPVTVPSRTNNFIANVTVKMNFDETNKLGYMYKLCTNTMRKVHDIVIKYQATQTSKYLSHSEQDTITVYKYIDCSPQRVH